MIAVSPAVLGGFDRTQDDECDGLIDLVTDELGVRRPALGSTVHLGSRAVADRRVHLAPPKWPSDVATQTVKDRRLIDESTDETLMR